MAEEALTRFGSRMKYKVSMSDSEGSPAMVIHRKEEETNNQEGGH